MYEIIVKVDGADEYELEWSEDACTNSYCEDCQDACNAAISSAIIALITCFPTLQTDLQRSTIKGDLNCQKIMGMVTGIVGTLSTLIALSAYADGCYNNLPENDGAGDEIVWELGPGFTCLLVATFLKPFDFLCHLIVPVEKPEETEKLEENASKDSTKV